MSYIVQHTLPSYAEVITRLPLPPAIKTQVQADRNEIKNIITGVDTRKLFIVGPCSSWPSQSVIEYAKLLKPLADDVKEHVKIVMRTYIQKPRTTVGWMGPLIQPNPFEAPHMPDGVFYCRKMMLDVLSVGLPIADEILFPRHQSYFRDLLSWAAIGARSSENQEHRVLSSMLDFPIGLKNPTSGDLTIATNSVIAAQSPNYIAVDGNQLKTSGNAYAHIVLRGGNGKPNISEDHLKKITHLLHTKNIKNPSIILDVSHDNTRDHEGKKQYKSQMQVLQNTLKIMQQKPELMQGIKGWMAESFLIEGSQNLNKCTAENVVPGQSLTDGCLDFETTKTLVLDLAQQLAQQQK